MVNFGHCCAYLRALGNSKKLLVLIALGKCGETPERGHYWPKAHNLNKPDRDLLDDFTYQTSRL